MSEHDIILGPDPNELRRHQKKLLTEREYRAKYRRADFYKPHPKQLEFHNLMETERALRAGNQLGKTHAGAAQMTMDALSLYPDWYKGRRFLVPPPIERPVEFLGWCASTTSLMTRDGCQLKLLGDITQEDGLGTGMIPLDSIVGRPTMNRGISNFVDSVSLRRETGGKALIQFRTFEMDRRAFQGSPVDVVWLDEQDEHDEIYGECLARLTSTKGRIYSTLTPMLGSNRGVRKRFRENQNGDMAEIVMGLEDAKHIPASEHAAIASRYKLSERATRLYGADLQGEGAVFQIPEDLIKHNRDPADIPAILALPVGPGFRARHVCASAPLRRRARGVGSR
jgi:phage terminase large subunit-like protein